MNLYFPVRLIAIFATAYILGMLGYGIPLAY